MNFSNRACLNDFYHAMIIVIGMDLGAKLKNAIVFIQILQHHLPFTYIVGKRFLAIDILAGLKGKRSDLSMPMVRRSARDGVDVLPIEYMPEVSIQFGLAI